LANGLAAKEVQLLHELVPKADLLGFLVNPNDPNAKSDAAEAQDAADKLGQKIVVVTAGTESDLEAAFATLARQHAGALFVDVEPFLAMHQSNIVIRFRLSHRWKGSLLLAA
jgi:putative ABC transport system substrate-binding protein